MVDEHVDRISSLNLLLLQHIMSFLPAQDVVRTCVLSKTWQNIWCFVPTLVLDQRLFKNKLQFEKFVSSLLLLQERSSNLQKFHLYLTGSLSPNVNVNAWIVSALRRNLKVLDIDIFKDMRLTNDIFTCEHLREFKLSFNILNLPAKIWLPALRSFHLIQVQVQKDQLNESLFEAMPSLEIFILKDCTFECHDLLRISAHQLKTLILEGDFPRSIEISAPSLTFLKLNNTSKKIPEIIRFCCDHIHLTDAYIRLPIQCLNPTIKMLKNTHTLTVFLS
ncbi:F-box/LRR-repeat protein, partial [Thalictrum thalictroides]